MQKKIITTICFVALVVVFIWAGVWYDAKEEQSNQEARAQAGAATIAAQNAAEQAIMQNLKMTDVVIGTGAEAQDGDTVSVLYTGRWMMARYSTRRQNTATSHSVLWSVRTRSLRVGISVWWA